MTKLNDLDMHIESSQGLGPSIGQKTCTLAPVDEPKASFFGAIWALGNLTNGPPR